MATWSAGRKGSGLLPILVGLLALCLTGCDTLQSADSSPSSGTPTPPPSAYHQVVVAAPPKASPVTPAPAAVPVVQTAEKPVVHKVAEPAQTAPVPVRTVETKPASPPAPAKGAETLVALSTAPPPRTSDSSPTSQKPAHASKINNVTPTSESQALFFKGPERPPPQPSHKFLWLGLGLGICAAAGGGATLVRLNSKRQVALALPIKKQSDDDVDLPREFKVKERRIFVEEEPVPTDKT